MFHNRAPPEAIQNVFKEASKIITRHQGGVVFKVQDLGWRNTAFPVIKPRVGKFFVGRWFQLRFNAAPESVALVQDLFNHNTGILRHIVQKTGKPSQLYCARTSFYPEELTRQPRR